jgi:hypothetical protein
MPDIQRDEIKCVALESGKTTQTNHMRKKPSFSRVRNEATCRSPLRNFSTLASFVALLHFVDDVDTTLATYQAIGAVAIAQGFEGIANFHQADPDIKPPVELTKCNWK